MAEVSPKKKYKQHTAPRISALSLAQYCVSADPLERAAILQAARYQRIAPIQQLGEARRCVNAYLADLRRDQSIIERIKMALTRKINAPLLSDFQRETAHRNLEAIKLFESVQQRLGLGRYGFEPVSRAQPHLIVGEVPVSVWLDLFVTLSDSQDGRPRCGAAIIQLAKMGPMAAEAKRQTTRTRREEQRTAVNAYVAVLIHQHLTANFAERGEPCRDHCVVIDPRAGEIIPVRGRLETQIRRLERGCAEVANQWDIIEPPKDYDGN